MKIVRFSLRIRLVFGLLLLWAFSTLVSSPLIRVDWSKQERNSREASLNDVALTEKKGSKDDANIVIATAVCGDRAVEEFLVLVKSALYFSNVTIKFIVFADKLTMKTMRQITRHWPANSPILSSSFNHQFDLRPIQFPDKLSGEWRNLYKPCASQRLFFPSLLEDIDSVLYLDTDNIFLASPESVWQHFNKINDNQIAAVAQEEEIPFTGWHYQSSRTPFFGKTGLNSGVMLMNLTRMRSFEWEKYVISFYKEFTTRIAGDQDIVNCIFHFHPDKVHVLPCNYNYRTVHCKTVNTCKSAEEKGVRILHGNAMHFHGNTPTTFRAVYVSFEQLGTDFHSDKRDDYADVLPDIIIQNLNQIKHLNRTPCGNSTQIIIKTLLLNQRTMIK